MNNEFSDLNLSLDWLEDEFALFLILGDNSEKMDTFLKEKGYHVFKIDINNYQSEDYFRDFMDCLRENNKVSHIWVKLNIEDDKRVSVILSLLNRIRSRLEANKKHVYIQLKASYGPKIVTYAPDLLTIRQNIIEI